ncbi:MAG: GNAT family N-acetyltransferase [Pseudomonadota bacterium]
MAAEDKQAINIEPLDPARHDRAAFTCRVERLDNFLNRTANKHQKGDFTRVWGATAPDDTSILGYYAINAHSLEGEELPGALTRNAPRNGIPTAYLSMIAVHNRAQGQGIGVLLMADALKRMLRASEQIGLAAVLLDVLNDDGEEAYEARKRFYEKMGFKSFPSQPSRMFLTIKEIRAAFAG